MPVHREPFRRNTSVHDWYTTTPLPGKRFSSGIHGNEFACVTNSQLIGRLAGQSTAAVPAATDS